MSEERTPTTSKGKSDWDEFDALTDEQVRAGIEADPDVHPTDKDFWKSAKVVMPQSKQTITIRLDPDVLEWYCKQGRGYQTRINAILRAYMLANQDDDSPR